MDGKHDASSMLAPWCYWNDSAGGGGGSNGSSSDKEKGERKCAGTPDVPAHLMPSEEEMALNRLYEQVPNSDHTGPPSLQQHSFEKIPQPPKTKNEGKTKEAMNEEEQMKAVVVLSMLGEMGIEDKTYDDVLVSLMANNWDENEALGSFF